MMFYDLLVHFLQTCFGKDRCRFKVRRLQLLTRDGLSDGWQVLQRSKTQSSTGRPLTDTIIITHTITTIHIPLQEKHRKAMEQHTHNIYIIYIINGRKKWSKMNMPWLKAPEIVKSCLVFSQTNSSCYMVKACTDLYLFISSLWMLIPYMLLIHSASQLA